MERSVNLVLGVWSSDRCQSTAKNVLIQGGGLHRTTGTTHANLTRGTRTKLPDRLGPRRPQVSLERPSTSWPPKAAGRHEGQRLQCLVSPVAAASSAPGTVWLRLGNETEVEGPALRQMSTQAFQVSVKRFPLQAARIRSLFGPRQSGESLAAIKFRGAEICSGHASPVRRS